MRFIYLLLILYFSIEFYGCELSCKDENNQNIDWFIALKYPHSYDFVYLSNSQQKWKKSNFNLSNSGNLVARTINQRFQKSSFYALYNDETPYKKTTSRGHLKGVINFDHSEGFWLVHSVPKFPQNEKYEFGNEQSRYGQSFFCVTLQTKYLKPIISQLLIMKPTVYNSSLPTDFTTDKELNDMLMELINNKNKRGNQYNQTIQINTFNGLGLLHFGKSNHFNDDLYAALVAPQLKTSIFVESWIRGEKIPSSCQINYRVYNVKEIRLPNKNFSETKDHSKWVVSEDQRNPFICIGDINRMTSQFKRGGGTLCAKDIGIWTMFRSLVMDYEHCGV